MIIIIMIIIANPRCVVNKKKSVNSKPNDKVLRLLKLKADAGDKINFGNMVISLVDRIENILGKGENASYQHFLLFPQCFLKSSLFGN